MRSKAILFVMLLCWAGAGGLSSCSRGEYSGKAETLTIATVPTEINAPLYIAEAQNFFVPNGLQVTIKENYDSGATATAIVRKRLKFDEAFMERVWPRYQFSLSLDQSLIAAMEDQARWMMSHNLALEKKVPDFWNYIHRDGLQAIKPEAVNIIR